MVGLQRRPRQGTRVREMLLRLMVTRMGLLLVFELVLFFVQGRMATGVFTV